MSLIGSECAVLNAFAEFPAATAHIAQTTVWLTMPLHLRTGGLMGYRDSIHP